MESIIQDPSVQELIGEWEAKGREQGREQGRAAEARLLLRKVLVARSFPVPRTSAPASMASRRSRGSKPASRPL